MKHKKRSVPVVTLNGNRQEGNQKTTEYSNGHGRSGSSEVSEIDNEMSMRSEKEIIQYFDLVLSGKNRLHLSETRVLLTSKSHPRR